MVFYLKKLWKNEVFQLLKKTISKIEVSKSGVCPKRGGGILKNEKLPINRISETKLKMLESQEKRNEDKSKFLTKSKVSSKEGLSIKRRILYRGEGNFREKKKNTLNRPSKRQATPTSGKKGQRRETIFLPYSACALCVRLAACNIHAAKPVWGDIW